MSAQSDRALVASKIQGSSDAPLGPGDAAWDEALEATFTLEPTPLESQPSAYVQASWTGKERGDVGSLAARALIGDGVLMLRLEWSVADASPAITDYDVYADACGVLFPTNGEAQLTTMGSLSTPVTAWYWRAGSEDAKVLTAKGLGTTRPTVEHGLKVRAEFSANTWSVVFSHPPEIAGFNLGQADFTPVGFAVWAGAAGERAGLKSHTPDWQELRIA